MSNSLKAASAAESCPLPPSIKQQVGKHLALVVQPLEPPGDHFVDAGEVVDPLHVADLEPLVAGLERQPVDELHQAGHGFAAGQVRDVDPFDRPRRLGQLEHLSAGRPGPSWDRRRTLRAGRACRARRARRAFRACESRRAAGPPFRSSSAAAAACISSRISSSSFFLFPSRNIRSRAMSRRYSSFEIRRLHGAVHWSIEANRQGRNQRHFSSSSSMSSEQVRNLKIFCSTCIAPRKLPALANGP